MKKGSEGMVGRFWWIAVLFLALVISPMGASALECTKEKPCKLVFSTCYKETFTSVKGAMWFMDEVTKRTNGRVVFDKYYSSGLLNCNDSLNGVSKGMADISVDSEMYHIDQLPLSNVLTITFITSDPWVHAQALNELIATEKVVAEEWTRNNIKHFYTCEVTPFQVFSKKPINKMEDLKGMKIRAVGPQAATYAAMGAIPVAFNMPDIGDALQKGTIDCADTFCFDIGVIYKLHESAPYSIVNPMGCGGAQALEMNLAKYNSLPKDIQKIFDEVAQEAYDKYIPMAMENDRHYMDIFVKEGGKVIFLSPEESKRWIEVGRAPGEKWWLDQMKNRKRDGEPVLKRFKELVAKWEKTGKSKYVDVYEYYKQKYLKK